MTTALLVAAGYVLGSMPWGYWLPRLFKHDDIRQHGSGNIGGTNVWRVYGWKLGAPVVVLDTLKGFAPAFVATLTVSHLAGVLAGGAAMLGHWRPMFLRWQRGGKVVATCGGAFLGVAPIVGGIGAAVWIVTFLLFRYASLASIVSALAVPVDRCAARGAVARDRVRRGSSDRRHCAAPRQHQPPARRHGEPLPIQAARPRATGVARCAARPAHRRAVRGEAHRRSRSARPAPRANGSSRS